MARQKWIARQPFQGKTAILCGGSKGIGKATACEFVALGGSLSLVARGREALDQAAREVSAVRSSETQFVETVACDTTDYDRLKPSLEEFVASHGVPDYLFNAVGYARPQFVEKATLDDFRQNMDVNYYGQLVPILLLLPHFMEARKGHIANVTSMMGYFGIAGYATYAPSKFALVGLTEVLRHELKPYNIRLSLLYPPDTDTPGFEEENRTKPEEVALMSAQAGLLSAEQVAEVFVEGVLKGDYHILPGEAKMIWRLYRYLPSLVRVLIDRSYQQARQKVGNAR